MLLAFFDGSEKIVLWVVLAAAALGLISLLLHTIIISNKAKKDKAAKDENQAEQNVQDTLQQEQEYLEANEAGEIVMSRNVMYSVGIDGQLASGKYTVENAYDATAKFNLRVNGLVREYESGDIISLTDGDTISPVSGSVIIARFGE